MRGIQQSLSTGWAKFAGLLIIAIMAVTTASASGLSGTYTIDPSKKASATNYTSFNDADSDLTGGARASGGTANGPGVSGKVTFNVANATYNEMVEIPAITGALATNTINFVGTDSSKAVIVATAGGSYTTPNFAVHLNNASFINFKGIGFQMTMGSASYSYYDHVVIVDNISDSNTFTNCMMVGAYAKGVTYYGSCIYSGYNTYSIDQFNTFTNNYIKNGYYGAYWLGNYSGTGESGNLFSGNTFDSMAYYGILAEYQDSISILGNKILMPYGGYAIYAYGWSSGSYGSSINTVANNFIAIGALNNSYGYGMESYALDNTNIVYNNINIYGPSSGACVYLYPYSSTTALNLYNNNLVNSGTGSVYSIYGNNFTNEDYDNLYSKGSQLVYYAGTSYTTLSAWKGSSLGFAANDTSIDPMFYSARDLHVNNPVLNGTATPLSYITTDIDGDTRNATTPDIGADEFTPPAVAPAVTNIDSPGSGFCAGSKDVYVKLSNLGLNKLTSATIEWSVNGTKQTAYSWTGSLVSGANASVKIGSYAFSSSTASYTVVSYPSAGNGTSVTATTGNTSTTVVRAGLTGKTYTIDNSGASADYTSLRAAVSDLNLKGVCGAVVFSIADGTYNESVQINAVANASAVNTVTFISASKDNSKVTIDSAWTGSFSSPATIVTFNGSSYVTFSDVTMINRPSYGSYVGVVNFTNGANHITISNNKLIGLVGYSFCGVVNNNSGSNENYLTITNNYIVGSYYTVYFIGTYGSAEKGNVLNHNTIDSSFGYSIFYEYQDSVTITKNKIFSNSGYTGIYFYNYNVTTTDTAIITNNFVDMLGTNSGGMQFYYLSLANIYYNSVNIASSSTYYYAANLYNYTTSTVNVIDNIFANSSSGPAISANASSVSNSDYNDLYSASGNVGNWSGTLCAKLTDWQTASSMDAHSVSGDPMFKSVSSGNLHLTGKSGVVAHKGTPIPGYQSDIDSLNVRNLTYPTIGAHELPFLKNDAGVAQIDSPAAGFCSGVKNIYVDLYNYGSNSISSVTVSWTVGGVAQTPYTWSSTLASGKDTVVKIGSVTFSSGVTQTIVAYTTKPNGAVDPNTSNDTTTRNVGGALNGTYTIGGSGASFATFRDAASALGVNGVCGPVVFNVNNGSYNESVTINAISGASAVNTVTFQSKSNVATNVVLDTVWAGTFTTYGYALELNGANYVRFHAITISNVPSSSYNYTAAVVLTNKASYNTFDSNVIATNKGYGAPVYNTYGTVEKYNTVQYNELDGGEGGVMMQGGYGTAEFGNVVNNNTIDSSWEYGILAEYQDSFTISKNNVFLTSGYAGMYIYNGGVTATDSSYVINNFVTAQSSYGYGILAYYCNLLNIYYNSVNASTSSTYYAAVSLINYATSTLNFVDNIVVNDNGGIAISANSYSLSYSDYNDLYTTGSTLGNYGGTSCATLTDWQSASYLDGNSVSGDPMFKSPSTGNLDLTTASRVASHKGTPIGITDDIHGNKRSTVKPCMGADERPLSPNDAGIYPIDSPALGFCAGTKDVYVTINNYGSNTLSSVTVSWTVNGTAKTSYSWTGTLVSGGSAVVKLGSVTFASGTGTKIAAWTAAPNGTSDGDPSNDSAFKTIAGALSGTYTIIASGGGNFTSFRDAAAALSSFGVCGPVTFNVSDATYNETVAIRTIPGSSAVNTVTFQAKNLSTGNVVIDSSSSATYPSQGYIVGLFGSQYVKFRYITIANSSTSYASAVVFSNGASNNVFEYDTISATSTVYSSYGMAVYFSTAANNNNTIQYCQIDGGEAGVYMYATSTVAQKGNVLYKNNVDSAWDIGIYAYYQDSFQFVRNNVFLPSTTYTGGAGIVLYNYGVSPSDSSLIANNFVTEQGTYASGIYTTNADMVNIYYNSINTSSSSATYPALYLNAYTSVTTNVIDNIIVNDNGGPAVRMATTAITVSNYNDLYTTGDIGYYGATVCASLSDWMSTSSQDANSVSADPKYNSPSTGDLHLTSSSSSVTGKGIPLTAVTNDIDGKTRSTKAPALGADEYGAALTYDVGVDSILTPRNHSCGNNSTIVVVRVRNFSKTTAASGFNVHVAVSGKASTSASVAFSGTLAAGSTSNVSVTFSPAFNTSSGGAYAFKAYTDLATDSKHSNDTTSILDTLASQPKSGFSLGSAKCSNNAITITNTGTGANYYRYYLENSLGSKVDSSIGTSGVQSITPKVGGNYRIVQLGVNTSSAGCYDTSSQAINVNTSPTADFLFTTACLDSAVSFTDGSTAGTGTITKWAWSFGNGNTSTAVNPSEVYTHATIVTAMLVITDSKGCKDSTTQRFTVDSVDASFSHSKPAVDGTVGFSATNTTLSSYSWAFGDGNSGSVDSLKHKYAYGHYLATLTATDSKGCMATTSDSIVYVRTSVSQMDMSGLSVQVYPNPFRDYTNITYSLNKESAVKIVVYDLTGRSIATLVDHNQTVGNYNLKFDASENNAFVSGTYIIRMTVGDHVITRQITLVK